MKILSWNCRGLGNPRSVRALSDLVRSSGPHVVGLIETKLQRGKLEWLKRKVGFSNGVEVARTCLGGGLMLLWRPEIQIALKSFSRYHIDVWIGEGDGFRLTIFYGCPITGRREETWNLLRSLKEGGQGLPWLVLGDFNEILFSWEYRGSRVCGEWQMRRFREAVEDCELSDLGYMGPDFTYLNKRIGEAEMRARLDRAFATLDWRSMFPNALVKHLFSFSSDHLPLLVDCHVLQRLWSGECTGVTSKLDRLREGLKGWNAREFGRVDRRIKELKIRLEWLHSQPRPADTAEEEAQVCGRIDEWLLREEVMWKQRSRADWLKEGDLNTRYFHLRASQRMKMNRIMKIQNSEGEWMTNEFDIVATVTEYFRHLFSSSSSSSTACWEEELVDVQRKLHEADATFLTAPFQPAEVRRAVFQMPPEKAPGMDGFGPLFFQKNWELVGEDIINQCLDILNEDGAVDSMNRTLITLIPKCKNPVGVSNYRPISLCNVLMKIVTKCLANRLKEVLHKVISETQSAFVPNRLITDNILLAHEVFHYIKTRSGMFNCFGALKLDMSKAYDRVDWVFMEKLQLKLGFPLVWVKKIMKCVTTVTYCIRVNNMISEVVVPERGIRQGDPISPYLFVICMEWLSCVCDRAQITGSLVGVKICRGAPIVSHLLFADDCLLFLKATLQNMRVVKSILDRFELLSGQKLNYEKSELFFGKNLDANHARVLCDYLGVKKGEGLSKYLGMPIIFGTNKTAVFRELEEKCWTRLHGWKEKCLSWAGKEILIKSILQAVPVFIMSCFKLHVALCKRLVSIVFSFWWGSCDGKKRICWVRRDLLTERKVDGGMGFKCLELFNESLLFKQVCRLFNRPQLLVSKVLRSRYFKSSALLDSGLGRRSSYAWRCLWEAKEKMCSRGLVQQVEELGESGDMMTVKEIYEAVKSIRRREVANVRGETSDQEAKRVFWSRLWRVKVQPKVKVFMWRVYHNALPTADNLLKRGCQPSLLCPVCGKHPESISHLLLYCDWARELWRCLFQEKGIWCQGCRDPGDWVWEIVRSWPSSDLSDIFNGAYAVWMNRNSKSHGNGGMDVRKDPYSCWRPPEFGQVKINADAAWNSRTRRAGAGCLGRTEASQVLFVWADFKESVSSVLEAEVWALNMAMTVAESMKLTKVQFETDSANVVDLVLLGGQVRSDNVRGDVLDCYTFLRRNHQWRIEHILREGNSAADRLAKKAKEEAWSWTELQSIPICVSNIVQE
ncbi:hypothetical protein QQ045_009146 [Rhodiola kirilowii]